MAAPFQIFCRPLNLPLSQNAKGKLSRGALATALALAVVPPWHSLAQETLPDEPQVVVIATDEDAADETSSNETPSGTQPDSAKRSAQPKLWLGVVLKTIEGDLASYLDIDGGVLVESVFPESPAAAAGLKKGDVLLTFADKELAAPGDVMAIMRDVDTTDIEALQSLTVTALRKGEELLLTITPTPRPGSALKLDVTASVTSEVNTDEAEENVAEDASQAEEYEGSGAFSFTFSSDQPFEEMQTLIEKIQQMNEGVEKEVQIFQLGNPAIRVSPSGELAELAASQESEVVVKKVVTDGKQLEITVTREGEGPAKITVNSNGDTTEYRIDEIEQLDKLSTEVREVVEPLLKKKGNRVLSFSAGGLKLDAELDQQEVKQWVERYQSVANEMSRKARVSAEEMRKKALQMADEVKAQAAASAQAHAENTAAGNPEVALLKQQVEELRAELKELRQKLEQ